MESPRNDTLPNLTTWAQRQRSMAHYNFRKVTVVPSAKDFVDINLKKTQRKTPTVVHKHYKISRIRQFYTRKVRGRGGGTSFSLPSPYSDSTSSSLHPLPPTPPPSPKSLFVFCFVFSPDTKLGERISGIQPLQFCPKRKELIISYKILHRAKISDQ